MSGDCVPCHERQRRRRYVAIDRYTSECLVRDEQGKCRQFATAMEAQRAAADLGHVQPGVRRVAS